jgi:hypothetical protein
MIYMGEWKKHDFEVHAPVGMPCEAFFKEVVREKYEGLWRHADELCIYVFRGHQPGQFAAYCDRD